MQLGKHGGDRGNQYTGGKRQADNVSLAPTGHGNTAAYTLARLDRDRPDLAARVRAAEPCARDNGLLAGSSNEGQSMTSAIKEKVIGGAAVFAAFGYLGAIIAGFIN